MSAINNVATAAGYTPAATLNCPPSEGLTVQILNAAVYYQLLLTPGPTPDREKGNHTAYFNKPGDSLTGFGSGIATEERQLLPGYWLFDRTDFQGNYCIGIQFRSVSSTNPAQVSASN
ncbi:MAG: hypothetical protein ABSF18_07715 [Gammaproteobacteria bacterium]|jgi:hypothetical protein